MGPKAHPFIITHVFMEVREVVWKLAVCVPVWSFPVPGANFLWAQQDTVLSRANGLP